jgi:hypothetical protein
MLNGIDAVIRLLREAGGKTLYLDGSFVSAKDDPEDWDGCWDMTGVDLETLDPIFFTFERGRAVQKAEYLGEFFPADMPTGVSGRTFLEFFQTDKQTGRPKGIIALDLRRWRP